MLIILAALSDPSQPTHVIMGMHGVELGAPAATLVQKNFTRASPSKEGMAATWFGQPLKPFDTLVVTTSPTGVIVSIAATKIFSPSPASNVFADCLDEMNLLKATIKNRYPNVLEELPSELEIEMSKLAKTHSKETEIRYREPGNEEGARQISVQCSITTFLKLSPGTTYLSIRYQISRAENKLLLENWLSVLRQRDLDRAKAKGLSPSDF